MVHNMVLKLNGYDPNIVSGFAFGMGIERIAMLLYGIDDLRNFYEMISDSWNSSDREERK